MAKEYRKARKRLTQAKRDFTLQAANDDTNFGKTWFNHKEAAVYIRCLVDERVDVGTVVAR